MTQGEIIRKITNEIEQLKAIATQELRQGSFCTTSSEESELLNEKAVLAYEALRNAVGNQNIHLLEEMDDSYMRASANEAEDHFIEGFARGYLYLQNLIMVPAVSDKVN